MFHVKHRWNLPRGKLEWKYWLLRTGIPTAVVAVVLYFAFSTEGIPSGFVGGVIFAIPVWFAARSIVRIFTDVANEDHTVGEVSTSQARVVQLLPQGLDR